jgi:proteic killer suppression protein
MEISFSSSKLQRICNDEKMTIRKWGSTRAAVIRRRLKELKAARTLAIARKLPSAKLHALRGDRKMQYAVDAEYPYRMVFEFDHNPLSTKTSGGVDLDKVTAIRILEVIDYHGD